MKNPRILVVDDDSQVAITIERCLIREKFEVDIASSGVSALESARQSLPDLILLDVMMPGMDGYDVCRKIRADRQLERVPIIFLTAKTSDEDHIEGFKAGGDDYINKPFNIEELVLHIRAVLKRTNFIEINGNPSSAPYELVQDRVELKRYCLNTKTFELTQPDGKTILLTPIQYDLMLNFMRHPGEVFSPTQLLSIIWGYPPNTGSPDLVRVHIKNLRMRIEEDVARPAFIETVSGHGYWIRNE